MSGTSRHPISDLTAKPQKEGPSEFRTFLTAIGDLSRPSQICIFGITGGHTRWTIIDFPEDILHLRFEDGLLALRPIMQRYRQEFKGFVPFFGRLTGFRLVRRLDYLRFDADGKFVEHVPERFRLGSCFLSLR